MFGKAKKSKEMITAVAEILSAEQTRWAVTHGSDNIVSNTEIGWKLRVMVRPPDAPAFEASFKASLPQHETPAVATMLSVRYNANDHDDIELDDSAAGSIEGKLSTIAKLRPDLATTQILGGSVMDIMRLAATDKTAFHAKLAEQAAAVQRMAQEAADAVTANTAGC